MGSKVQKKSRVRYLDYVGVVKEDDMTVLTSIQHQCVLEEIIGPTQQLCQSAHMNIQADISKIISEMRSTNVIIYHVLLLFLG